MTLTSLFQNRHLVASTRDETTSNAEDESPSKDETYSDNDEKSPSSVC